MKLRYLGLIGPNEEKRHEVRVYPKAEAEELLRQYPHHFELIEEIQEEKPRKNNSGAGRKVIPLKNKRAKTQDKK